MLALVELRIVEGVDVAVGTLIFGGFMVLVVVILVGFAWIPLMNAIKTQVAIISFIVT